MSTSFIQIKSIKSQRELQERVSHIVQEHNRFKGVLDNIIYINEDFSSDKKEPKTTTDTKTTPL